MRGEGGGEEVNSEGHVTSPPGTVAEGAPIIPISAQLKYNIEVICEYVTKKIPIPLRDFTAEPRLIGEWRGRRVRGGRGW